ncbi:MAG: pyridoxal-phosphate dependent enzyme [Candidatus Micrarchaeaceae archaeon]
MEYTLKCTACGAEYKSSFGSQICGKCSSILEVVYLSKPKIPRKTSSFWDFYQAFPKGNYRHYELGMTRLMQDKAERSLFYKLEILNPTHSFKDRGSVIEVAKAMEYGFDEIVCASTGNMAYSIAYYAKLYGIKSKIFVSRDANADKIDEIRSTHDADITRGEWDFTGAQKKASDYAAKNGAFLAGDYCYRKEGQKSIAYEIMCEMPDIKNIIVPVGNATLLSATLKALEEVKNSWNLSEVPRVIAVQASKCSPLVKAFGSHKKVAYVPPMTAADAIAVGYPTFGDQAIEALRRNKGNAVSVSEAKMAAAQRLISEEYGLTVEMASAATLAAYKDIKKKLNGKTVLVISGGNV